MWLPERNPGAKVSDGWSMKSERPSTAFLRGLGLLFDFEPRLPRMQGQRLMTETEAIRHDFEAVFGDMRTAIGAAAKEHGLDEQKAQ